MGARGPQKGSKVLPMRKKKTTKGASQEPPKPKAGRPPVPAWVPPEGRRFVRKLIPQLERDGLLDLRDAGSMAAMGSVYAILAMAMKAIEEEGVSVPDPEHPVTELPQAVTPQESTPVEKPAVRKHPLISVVMAANEKLNAWSKEFGLSPAARRRLGIEPPKGASKLEKFLAGKKY